MSRFEDGPSFRGGPYGEHGGHSSGRGRSRHRPRGRGGSFGSPGRGGMGSKYVKPSYDDQVEENVKQLFSKKYKFQSGTEKWELPDHTSMFRPQGGGLLPELKECKLRVNAAKDKLDDTESLSWSKHTSFTNRACGLVGGLKRDFQAEMCTMSWAKMHEILWSFDVVPKTAVKYNSVHLCEAPGAFVASLNHFLKTHRTDCVWKWMATTLNPYYEGNSLTPFSDQDFLMSETKQNWFVGPDNTGDITHWENVVALKEAIKKDIKDVHLVTADGGLSSDSFSDPNRQEENLCKLLYCEVVCGILLLALEGTLVVKAFTIFEPHTVSLLYLLACCFEEVNLFKPVTSKTTNSEHYLVCRKYKGRPSVSKRHWEQLINHYGEDVSMTTIFPMETIPKSFVSKVVECALKFTDYQVKGIDENLDLYECMPVSKKKRVLEERDLTCDKFRSNSHLKKLSRDKGLIPTLYLDGTRVSVAPVVRSEEVVREWLERRSIDSFLTHLSQRKQAAERGIGDSVPEAKIPRITLDQDVARAVKHLLTAIGYDGSKAADKGVVVAMEMEPMDVQWLRGAVSTTYDILKDIQSLKGSKVDKIMDSSHTDEHTDIAGHMTPGHALRALDPPFFLGKDAVDFAALDYMTGFVKKSPEVLLFMDLAGAPSGFSHYIYWRRQNSTKGWGLVRSEQPLLGPGPVMEKLAPWETFQVLGPHSGVDICDGNTIRSLCAGVENYCPDGVQIVVGDVPNVPFGAHPPGQCELQVNQQLLSQLICALKILGKGGTFVCRCYELLSRFSAGVLFLAYKLFREVTVLKPMTSSPTSPERFILCRGYHGNRPDVADSLLEINGYITELLGHTEEKSAAVLEIVPMHVLLDETFHRYLTQSNERVAKYRTKMITIMEETFQNPELLPDAESQQLLCRGIMEILDIPSNPL